MRAGILMRKDADKYLGRQVKAGDHERCKLVLKRQKS